MEILSNILNIDPNIIIIGLLVIFFTLEQIIGNPFKFNKRGNHLLHNILFQVTLTILNLPLAALLVYSIEWLNSNEIGLLHLIEMPFWLKLIAAVALYDFTTYWIHRASHKFPLLWRLHRVNHKQEQLYTDSNFADIYIVWDRLFGTFKTLPIEKMKYGLIEFPDEKSQTFLYLMKSPFMNIERFESEKSKKTST